jgi:hypothetical protein
MSERLKAEDEETVFRQLGMLTGAVAGGEIGEIAQLTRVGVISTGAKLADKIRDVRLDSQSTILQAIKLEPSEVNDIPNEAKNVSADPDPQVTYNEYGIPTIPDQLSNDNRILEYQSGYSPAENISKLGLFEESKPSLAQNSQSNLSYFGEPHRPIGDIITPSESLIKKLDAFGMTEDEIDRFFKGHEVQFEAMGGARHPITSFILFKDNLLSIGIYSIYNVGGGGLPLLRFRTHALSLAKELELREVEIFGIKVVNEKLEKLLIKQGFESGPEITVNFMGQFVVEAPTFRKIFKVPQPTPSPSLRP